MQSASTTPVNSESTFPTFAFREPRDYHILLAYSTEHVGLVDFGAVNMIDFFWDTPWGQVPTYRNGNLQPLESYPAGGLLGGAPKSSKLAALAAARKKQHDEKRLGHNPDLSSESPSAVSLLDKLVKSPDDGLQSPTSPQSPTESAFSPSLIFRRKTDALQMETPTPEEPEQPEFPVPPVERMKANPSLFARALCGPESTSVREDETSTIPPFELPYAKHQQYKADVFSKPSPDDVVLAAQRKGTFK